MTSVRTLDRPALLMTRPKASADRFVARLSGDAQARVRLVHAPLIRIAPTGTQPDLAGQAGVIFTSANGVRFAPQGAGRTAYCVGRTTTDAATVQGWDVRHHATDAAHLLDALVAAQVPGPLVHLAGRHTRGNLAQRLTHAGIATREHTLYDQHLLPLTAAARAALDAPNIVPLFSPRTARQLGAEAPTLARSHVVALSAAVAEALAGHSVNSLHILATPDADMMRKAVEKLCLRITLP
ncbi:uroporphyrinogen-III synthase [Sulfitobacter sp. S190]|uniref:uroporphyrinogen-III synthase n=1 Tax=Sulfitobacter sp. S190 TaxID=2867022 RepID=UPI0021A4411B|nr:uroporphyrinogen-III synthase [Sulfitobacter sp. S190]UWR22435.1 uroporphyrinogen-III synthase [Sulfitobacter sp. S190]